MGQASIIGLPHLFLSTTASLANEIRVLFLQVVTRKTDFWLAVNNGEGYWLSVNGGQASISLDNMEDYDSIYYPEILNFSIFILGNEPGF
jgi:hypothetical protein